MLFINDCEYAGKNCDWVFETVTHEEDGYYGSGKMNQRRCLVCGKVEYAKFMGYNGKTVDIDQFRKESGRLTLT